MQKIVDCLASRECARHAEFKDAATAFMKALDNIVAETKSVRRTVGDPIAVGHLKMILLTVEDRALKIEGPINELEKALAELDVVEANLRTIIAEAAEAKE